MVQNRMLGLDFICDFYSKLNRSSTVHSSIFESFNPNSRDGKYLLFSIELMVCLDTPNLVDKSSWVRLNLPLYILMLFFITMICSEC